MSPWVVFKDATGYHEDLDAFVPHGATIIPPTHATRPEAAKHRDELRAAAEFAAALEAGQQSFEFGEEVEP